MQHIILRIMTYIEVLGLYSKFFVRNGVITKELVIDRLFDGCLLSN